jgi:hypothetical protein
MLQINPYLRASPNELLKSPLFDNIRRPPLEKSASLKLKLELDSSDAFDYENNSNPKFTRKELIFAIIQEAKDMNQRRQQIIKEFRDGAKEKPQEET